MVTEPLSISLHPGTQLDCSPVSPAIWNMLTWDQWNVGGGNVSISGLPGKNACKSAHLSFSTSEGVEKAPRSGEGRAQDGKISDPREATGEEPPRRAFQPGTPMLDPCLRERKLPELQARTSQLRSAGQIQPAASFSMACELHIVFAFGKMV